MAKKENDQDAALAERIEHRNRCRDRVGEHAGDPGPSGTGGRVLDDIAHYLPGDEPEPVKKTRAKRKPRTQKPAE